MTQDQEQNTALLPKDTNAALRTVMGTIKKMNALYEEETTALQATNSKKFMSLQDKKIKITRAYETQMAQMLARQNEIKTADSQTKEKLKQLYAEFSDVAERNLRAISRMQRSTERLGNTIRNAAIKSAQKQRGYIYGETGELSPSSQRKVVSSGLSETV